MFKSNVKEIMEKKGVTVRALAEDTELSTRTVQKARDERIESCTLKTLAAMAEVLGVKVKKLFDEA